MTLINESAISSKTLRPLLLRVCCAAMTTRRHKAVTVRVRQSHGLSTVRVWAVRSRTEVQIVLPTPSSAWPEHWDTLARAIAYDAFRAFCSITPGFHRRWKNALRESLIGHPENPWFDYATQIRFLSALPDRRAVLEARREVALQRYARAKMQLGKWKAETHRRQVLLSHLTGQIRTIDEARARREAQVS